MYLAGGTATAPSVVLAHSYSKQREVQGQFTSDMLGQCKYFHLCDNWDLVSLLEMEVVYEGSQPMLCSLQSHGWERHLN